MNIIIVGCGKVGRALTQQLNEAGNNITVIDLVPEKVNELTDRYDVMGITGNGATHAVLEDAGIDEANLLIAVTVSIALMCTVFLAKFIGCSLPILAQKIGFDPAVMAGPFITTIVDVTSLLILFGLALMLVPKIA